MKVKVIGSLVWICVFWTIGKCVNKECEFCMANFRSGQFSGPMLDDVIILGVSYLQCVKRCGRRPGCIAMSYVSSAKYCVLNFKSVGPLPRVGGVFSEKVHWNPDWYVYSHSRCAENQVYRYWIDECKNAECNLPSQPTNGIYVGNMRRYSSKLAILCNHGYTLTGNTTSGSSYCTRGQWKNLEDTCIPLPESTTMSAPMNNASPTSEPSDPLVPSEPAEDPPVPSEQPTEPPVPSEPAADPPVPSEPPTDPPVTSEQPTDPPVPSEPPTDPPVTSEQPTDPPVPSEPPTDPPVTSEQPTDPPVPSEPPTDPPVTSEPPTDPPVPLNDPL